MIKTWKNTEHLGDCLEVMKHIPDKSVDFICTDLPFDYTEIKWDKLIPFEPLWKEYNRIIKDNGSIALFANQPFTSMVVMSNLEMFKYPLVWQKNRPTRHFQAQNRLLPIHEDILIFGKYGCSPNSKLLPKFNHNGKKSNYTQRKKQTKQHLDQIGKYQKKNIIRNLQGMTEQF